MPIDPQDLRNTLVRFATGITIVTTLSNTGSSAGADKEADKEVRGLTVNAFMSVAIDPPTVLVSIDRQAKAHATLAQSERYGVSVLAEDQEALSNHFAGRGSEGLEVNYLYLDGFPLIEGALAHFVCRITAAHEVADHTLYVGEVEHASWREGNPLVYFGRQYGRFRLPELEPPLDR